MAARNSRSVMLSDKLRAAGVTAAPVAVVVCAFMLGEFDELIVVTFGGVLEQPV